MSGRSGLYVVTGWLKPDSEAILDRLQGDFNEHLSQPFRRVRLAGALFDSEGRRSGFMALIEAADHDAAEAYLRESPVFKAGLYAEVDVAELDVQLGSFGG
jgi:uncharacterized protein YciI